MSDKHIDGAFVMALVKLLFNIGLYKPKIGKNIVVPTSDNVHKGPVSVPCSMAELTMCEGSLVYAHFPENAMID